MGTADVVVVVEIAFDFGKLVLRPPLDLQPPPATVVVVVVAEEEEEEQEEELPVLTKFGNNCFCLNSVRDGNFDSFQIGILLFYGINSPKKNLPVHRRIKYMSLFT